MHCQKLGLDIGTWISNRRQLWFGQDGLNLALVPGRTSNKFPNLRQCKTLAVIANDFAIHN